MKELGAFSVTGGLCNAYRRARPPLVAGCARMTRYEVAAGFGRAFDGWTIRNVPRVENSRADRLVNEALDASVEEKEA